MLWVWSFENIHDEITLAELIKGKKETFPGFSVSYVCAPLARLVANVLKSACEWPRVRQYNPITLIHHLRA